jgi:hypothetical protein
MIKELFLALIFGALIGFGASGTFFGLKKKNSPVIINSQTPTSAVNISSALSPTPATQIDSTSSFEIFSPLNNSVTNSSTITLKGMTIPKSLIVVSTQKSSFQTEADSSGNFSIDVGLDAGANHLKISSISPDDSQQTQEIWVTYSTAKIQ